MKNRQTTDTQKTVEQKTVVTRPEAEKQRTPPQYPPCPGELNRIILAANHFLDWQNASQDEKDLAAKDAAKKIARYYYPETSADLLAAARGKKMSITEFRRHLLWNAQNLVLVLNRLVDIRHRFTEWNTKLTSGELARIGQWDLVLHLPTYDPQTSNSLYGEIMSICEKKGVPTDRFKRCVICHRFYWAKKPSTPYCERKPCYHTHNKSTQRKKGGRK